MKQCAGKNVYKNKMLPSSYDFLPHIHYSSFSFSGKLIDFPIQIQRRLVGMLWGHSVTTWTRWGGRGSKMSVFVHAQGINLSTQGKKRQKSVHVVVECPLWWSTMGPVHFEVAFKFMCRCNSSIYFLFFQVLVNQWKIRWFNSRYLDENAKWVLSHFERLVGTKWIHARTTDTWWLDPKFSTAQNHITVPNKKSCKMYENLSFLQKKMA